MISQIELQGMIPRTQDYSQMKQNEDARPMYEHANIQNMQQKTEILKHEHVVKQDNAEKKKENYDAKEKGNGSYGGNTENHKRREQNNDGTVKVKGSSSFDISV